MDETLTETRDQPPKVAMSDSNAQIQQEKSRGGCFRSCLLLILIGACLIGLLFGGAFFWLRSQQSDLIEALIQGGPAEVGQERLMAEAIGTGTISVLNFADEPAFISIVNTDLRGGSDATIQNIEPFDQAGRVKFAGLHDVKFYLGYDGFGERPPELAICSLNLERGDIYHFILLADQVLVSNEGDDKSNKFDVANSDLCRKEEMNHEAKIHHIRSSSLVFINDGIVGL